VGDVPEVVGVTVSAVSARLAALIEAIRKEVRSGDDPDGVAARVARALQRHLSEPSLLTAEHRASDPHTYRQHVLHVEPDGAFSVVSLVWLPGQATPIHDHISWCVVGVHQGEEHESQYRLIPDDPAAYLIETGRTVNRTASVAAYTPPGDIHRVANDGPGMAISLHIYGADIGKLGTSIRRRYDLEVRTPAPRHR